MAAQRDEFSRRGIGAERQDDRKNSGADDVRNLRAASAGDRRAESRKERRRQNETRGICGRAPRIGRARRRRGWR
jgi:hypothetical protein